MQRLMFFEIAEGHFADQAQRDFEAAQNIAHSRGVPIKVSMEITVFPESRAHRGTGKVRFKTSVREPAKDSIEFITEVSKEGLIMDSGHRQNQLKLNDGKGGEA